MSPPILVTPDLGRRLERSSQVERAAYMDMHRRLFPERDAGVLQIGGAFASVSGSHVRDEGSGHRAFSRCLGLGFEAPVTDAVLDEIERFYAAYRLPARIDLCPLAAPELTKHLAQRAYVVEAFLNIWVRGSDAVSFDAPSGIEISLATTSERQEWRDTLGRGFASDDSIATDPIADTVSQLPGKLLFLARIDGIAVGAAAAQLADTIGLVNGASTRLEYRGRGVQQALLAARIRRLAGQCELMTVVTAPGSVSERNIQRFGFELAFTKAIMRGPSPTAG